MILSELIDAFRTDLFLQSTLRQSKEIILIDKQIALMLSKTCSEIQKKFGVIELTMSVPIVIGTNQYALTSSMMNIKQVMPGQNCVRGLVKKSTDWFDKQIAANGNPEFYTVLYSSAIPQLWIYPTPIIADTLTVSYKPNFNLYSPSNNSTTQDFGSYLSTGFTGDTVFPTQYDNLLLLGMMKQVYPDMQADYTKEAIVLLSKQFSGEKLDYRMDVFSDGHEGRRDHESHRAL